MALDPDRYRLSDAEHEAVFQGIRVDIFSHSKTSQQPVAVIFGGQPGSGKSVALSEAIDELRPRGGAAEIIGDDFRSYHPAFRQLMAQDDKTAAFYTDRDPGRWVERELAAAVFRELSPVEGVKTHPESAGAYAAMAAIDKRLEADGARPATRSIVLDRARENLAQSIEQGANVVLKVKVQQDRNSERDAER